VHSSHGYEGRRHGASAVSLASIIILTSPVPPLLITTPAANEAEALSDAEVTAQLQQLMRTGITNLRTRLPNILGYIEPPSPAPAPSPFQHTCRIWTESVRAAPASLVMGSSRLASPPLAPSPGRTLQALGRTARSWEKVLHGPRRCSLLRFR
jgi:hypothetical protein